MLHVEKRNGNIVVFEEEKIVNAIKKAMGETDLGIDEDLAQEIAHKAFIDFSKLEVVNIEKIQDFVEVELMKSRPDVARLYIIYREERAKLREQGWVMSDLQRDIYEKKYRFENESFDGFLTRVSGGNNAIKKAIKDKKFMPAGRILAGRGLDKFGRKITLSNCYVMPKVEDNIESIFDTAKYLARTYSYGGGVGLTISKLRPKGSRVNNAANTTTGAVSFMDLFSMVTGLIGMRGRRGALMLNMDCNHPDIEDFIDVKNDLSKVNYANISVNIDDKFMNAVKNNEEYDLYFKVEATGEEIKKIVNARELFEKLSRNNWNMAEPGILFQDKINSWHLMSEDKDFEFAGVNPCAEETLPAFGSCNLSSINLAEFVKNPFTKYAYFEYEKFGQMVRDGVIYLNEVLDENMELHPLEEQREMSRELRQIGLGIMGLADMFIKLGIKYGSEESISLIHKVGHTMINEALRQSALMAKEYGPFPRYKREAVLNSPFLLENATEEVLGLIKEYGLRNSQLLTIPPTGSISTLIGCSNGVEPIFQVSYTRKSESLHNIDTYYKVFTPIVKDYMDRNHISKEEDLPDFFITTSNLNYKDRIDVQAAWQQYIDASISSTVNVPNEFTVEEVEELYIYAWERGLKGVTIYRDGCARSGILITDKPKENRLDKIDELKNELNKLAAEQIKENPEICPMCGGTMMHSGGCAECQDCGYSPCSF
ncbi:ribonucleoside-diphosphate reductase, adenosylcobalamin-dependent [Tissierella sp. P1]|jgi:ribonucleoside-diphosphate reductase alpha chain|uniref:adenosylcobalamin-dependent ribonucleoside-diphosphate reductase n=1 Tax=Tissierella TaxID=41273 RepID=UPI000BA07988|nr:adenosylcobalamin-dependent ribonucleoside-diphosphate reductase [Tissierella sp. P1]MDU5080699.1 adenosylcobalamin-dependent ribonucleoside-diphosphate reductase [Bacillota bacterium]OZV10901.1 ribonucleoside-diphosphate reductase, adenosylcobalamin-dependent [Tissierella sp. P1]